MKSTKQVRFAAFLASAAGACLAIAASPALSESRVEIVQEQAPHASSASTNPLDQALAAASGEGRDAGARRQPDVLFIAIDDLNDWIDTLDGPATIRTPNITALANRGMLFTRAFAPGTSCTPSRTAILTGMSPFNSGLYSHNVDWRVREGVSDKPTLPRYFRENGYATYGSGKLFHAHTYGYLGVTGQPDPNAWDGYFPSLDRQLPDQIVPAAGRYPGSAAAGHGRGTNQFDFAPAVVRNGAMGDEQVADYVMEQLETPRSEPSFIAAGIFRPHLPWYAPERFFDMYPIDDIELPPWRVDDLDDVPALAPYGFEPGIGADAMNWVLEDNRTLRWRQAIQGYMASASYADYVVGELLASLERSGRADNTIIVLWSDHGYHLGEKSRFGKMTLWERTAHVPFIIVAPGVTTPGSRSDQAVSLQSIYATLAELAGLERPAHIDGQSLVPLLRNPDMEWDEMPITVHTYGNYAVRDDRYRYIIYADGSEELYDMATDPNEWTNLASDPAMETVLRRLRAAIPEDQAEPQEGEGDARAPEDALRG